MEEARKGRIEESKKGRIDKPAYSGVSSFNPPPGF